MRTPSDAPGLCGEDVLLGGHLVDARRDRSEQVYRRHECEDQQRQEDRMATAVDGGDVGQPEPGGFVHGDHADLEEQRQDEVRYRPGSRDDFLGTVVPPGCQPDAEQRPEHQSEEPGGDHVEVRRKHAGAQPSKERTIVPRAVGEARTIRQTPHIGDKIVDHGSGCEHDLALVHVEYVGSSSQQKDGQQHDANDGHLPLHLSGLFSIRFNFRDSPPSALSPRIAKAGDGRDPCRCVTAMLLRCVGRPGHPEFLHVFSCPSPLVEAGIHETIEWSSRKRWFDDPADRIGTEVVGMLVEDLERVLDELAPRTLTEPWDTTGLLVGRRGTEISKVIVALDLSEDVVVEAVTGGYQAIVTHHPLLFAPSVGSPMPTGGECW